MGLGITTAMKRNIIYGMNLIKFYQNSGRLKMVRDTKAYRRAYGLCTCCGQVKVTNTINCRSCADKRNKFYEKKYQQRWDKRVEHEEYLREDLKLVTTKEAAVILGIKPRSVYRRVFRGKLSPVRRDIYTWFYKPDLMGL